MEVKVFKDLPQESIDIRNEVFVDEQGFNEEFGEQDDNSVHFVLFDESQAVATCRVFYSPDNESHMLGRIAVRKAYRGKRIGAMVVESAEKYIREIKGKRAMLFAQKRAKGFYDKLGYVPSGYEADEEGCPHIMMIKEW